MPRKHVQVVQTQANHLNISEKEQALLSAITKGYEQRRLGSLNHTEKSVQGDLRTLNDFLTYTQKAPWNADEDDFDAWCYHIGVERKLATESQRKYQTAIQQYYRYFTNNVKFRAEILNSFGVKARQIVTEENKIPHVNERQRTNERPAFTHLQIEQFFDAIDEQIVEAYKFRSKEFLILQRDKAMFYTLYILALRNSEARGLTTNSFRENPGTPEYGDFGFATVYGKGSNGSGPKIRTVPVDNVNLPPILQWYVDEVRPRFLEKPHCDPNTEAFFLTERGTHLNSRTLIYRFNKILKYAGLEGLGFVPHCLRHTYTTHAAEAGLSVEYSRRKLGHEFSATTQGYTHCGDEFVNKLLNDYNRSQIDTALQSKDTNGGGKK
ncbi:tyrosine recombinase XerD [Mariprofundus micogutta]|uniref:Tyrosine recombinase XerD n=1 Tax=Mariprofundus micogutta TaxID=1921010 RepID=A0A1L8CN67_9PROT|nr:site-specific integrase [Mariprofundus micogutta]GAV20360.1 tyrosine recombinase XerD [Mariprofundus micogutta]